MRIKTFIFLLIIFLNSLVSAAPAQRQIYSYSMNLSHQDQVGLFGPYIDHNLNDVLQVYLEEDRSYQCSVTVKNIDKGFDELSFSILNFSLNVEDPAGARSQFPANGLVYPAIASGVGPATLTDEQRNKSRISITASQTGLYTITTTDKGDFQGDKQRYAFHCRETTLYGSFNRFFAESTIVELSNAAATDIQVQITIIDGGGNILVNKQANIARANTRSDVIFPNLPAATYGQIIITHDAPFGALSGYVSEYDVRNSGEIVLKRERALKVSPLSNTPTQ